MKKNNNLKMILFLILGTIFCGVWFLVVAYVYEDGPPPWYSLTSPLEQRVVDDLCKKLYQPMTEPEDLCGGEKDVYADEFLYALRSNFPKGAAYDTVQEQLAEYQIKVNRLDNHMSVYYDFRGDGVILMEFYFTNDKLYNIFSNQNYDDWNPGRIKHLTEEAALTQAAK